MITTYDNDAGIVCADRRRRSRDHDDPRIDHIFNGLDNIIQRAEMNDDRYAVGYTSAIRLELGQLIASLIR